MPSLDQKLFSNDRRRNRDFRCYSENFAAIKGKQARNFTSSADGQRKTHESECFAEKTLHFSHDKQKALIYRAFLVKRYRTALR